MTNHKWVLVVSLVLCLLVLPAFGTDHQAQEPFYEVWAIDQSDSLDGTLLGGNLYVLRGTDGQFMAGAATMEHFNLKTEAQNQGFEGGLKPHMTLWNTGATHLLVGHASSGHVYAIEGESRRIVDEITPGGNSHAAVPAPDNSVVLVADIGGQTVHRVDTEYAGGVGNIFGTVSSLDLAAAGVPALVEAPHARPICPIIEQSSTYAYITLAAGGLAILDITTTPMEVVHTYTTEEVAPNGCGGIQIGATVYVNSGNADPAQGDFLYAFDNAALVANPATRPPFKTIPLAGNDSHGALQADAFLWVGNRASNTLDVFDTMPDPFDPTANPAHPLRLVNVIDLVSSKLGNDPAPDLIDISPSGGLAFLAQRGPLPISANDPTFNNAQGDSPGVGVVQVTQAGKSGTPKTLYDLSNVVGSDNIADIHSLRVRK